MKRIDWNEILKYEVFLCDLDGVVWREEDIIWDNVETLKELKKLGKKLIFITNNSTKTPKTYHDKLLSIGIYADLVITSSMGTAEYLKKERIEKVFVIGEEGLYEVIKSYGISLVEESPEAVVVGLDREFNYSKLKRVSNLLYKKPIKFIATNTDAHIKKRNEILPGAGAIVNAISYASGKSPDVVIGKPNRYIYNLLKIENPKKYLCIGDRLDTDIKGGINMGIDTLFLLTGVHTLEDTDKLKIYPDYYAESLSKEVLSG